MGEEQWRPQRERESTKNRGLRAPERASGRGDRRDPHERERQNGQPQHGERRLEQSEARRAEHEG